MANQLQILSILLVLVIMAKTINCRPSPEDLEPPNVQFGGIFLSWPAEFRDIYSAVFRPRTSVVDSQPSITRRKRSLTSSEVFERIRKVVSDQLDVNLKMVTENATFIYDLGAYSLGTVELIAAVEEKFSCEIPKEEAAKLKTVGQLFEYVYNKCNN